MDNKEEDTVEYDFRKTYQYKPELNGPGLTGEEMVTIAHPLILTVMLAINIDRKDLLPFVNKAMNKVLHGPQDIFFTGRLWDILYDGIIVDCSSGDIEVTAACSEMDSGDYGVFRRINATALSFSMFGNVNTKLLFQIFSPQISIFVDSQTNGTSFGRYKALRGKKNITDVGQVLEYNGLSQMQAWDKDECNRIKGTDGTIFPAFQEKEQGFTIFIPEMCRAMTVEYQHPSTFSGIKTNKFTMSFDVSKYGWPNCYCRDADFCPSEGITDLHPCHGAPISVSAPHFYKGTTIFIANLLFVH